MELQLDGVTDVFDENKINNGVWIHLTGISPDDEGDDVPLYLDPKTKKLPMRALVRSIRCDLIADLEEKAQGDGWVKVQKAPKKLKADASKHMMTKPADRFPLLLVAFDNVSKAKPGRQDVKPEDARAIFKAKSYAGFVDQIQNTSVDDELYKMDSETETGEPVAVSEPGAETAKED